MDDPNVYRISEKKEGNIAAILKPVSKSCKCYTIHIGDDPNPVAHKCCGSGTVFNPSIRLCDWPENVPDCDQTYKTMSDN